MKRLISLMIIIVIVLTSLFSVSTVSASAARLKTPVVKSTEVLANGVKLTWSRIPGAARYRVFLKTGNRWKIVANTRSTSWVDKKAKVGKTYTYTIRCVSKNGRKYTSSFYRKGFTVKRLATPQIVKSEAVSNGLKITWKAVKGAARYRVFVKNGTKWNTLGYTTGVTWTDKTAKPGKAYTYTVRCVTKNGRFFTSYFNKSGYTAVYSPIPVITSISSTDAGMTVKWNKTYGAARYRVFLKSESGWNKLTDTKNTQYVYRNAEDGESYTFAVRCFSASGNFSSYYNTNGVTISYTQPIAPDNPVNPTDPVIPSEPTNPTTPNQPTDPTAPTQSTDNHIPAITKKEIVNNNIKFSWNKFSGIYTYAVYLKNGTNWQLLDDEVMTGYYLYPFSQAGVYTFAVISCNPTDDTPYTTPDRGEFSCTVNYVVDQESYSYQKPITTQEAYCCCNKCGADVTGDENGKVGNYDPEHSDMDMVWYHYSIEGCSTAWHTAYRTVITGYETINVPEKGHFEIA